MPLLGLKSHKMFRGRAMEEVAGEITFAARQPQTVLSNSGSAAVFFLRWRIKQKGIMPAYAAFRRDDSERKAVDAFNGALCLNGADRRAMIPCSAHGPPASPPSPSPAKGDPNRSMGPRGRSSRAILEERQRKTRQAGLADRFHSKNQALLPDRGWP